MTFQTSEQLVHDRINLARLVRRLEKAVSSENWSEDTQAPPKAVWIKTRATLQKLKYARKLLHNVELHEDDPKAFQRYEDVRQTLDRLQNVIIETDKRVGLKPTRPPPILPTLPLPKAPIPVQAPLPSAGLIDGDISDTGDVAAFAEANASNAAQELLLSPSDTDTMLHAGPINPSATLLPPNLPSSPAKSTSTGTPAFLQNSAALQEELSAQLAQMAAQLKRNALHFADSLDKDKALVLEAEQKLERNHDVMKKERLRVRDHRSKSWGTTWIVILSVVVAAVGFVLTFFVIRIT